MYPTLYHAFLDLFGLDWPWMKILNSFGFFVAIAFIAASMVLSKELKRKEQLGLLKAEMRKLIIGKPVQWSDVFTNALIGFLLGWKFIWLMMNANELFAPGSLPQQHIFSWQGNWWLGILLALAMGAWRWYDYYKKQLPKPEERIVDFHPYEYTGSITFVAAIGGILGAKIFAWLEDPQGIIQSFSNFTIEDFLSGLTVYGGLIVGGAAVLLYARKIKMSLLHLMDATAPGLILAYGIGRMGCQVSGDGDWGITNTNPKPGWLSWLPDSWWAYDYPNNVNGEGIPMITGGWEGYNHVLPVPVYPTPIYEIVMAFAIFGVLWYLRKKISVPGVLFGWYMIFCGAERFLIEKIRVNSTMDFIGLKFTQAELISVLFLLAGSILIFWLHRKTPVAPGGV